MADLFGFLGGGQDPGLGDLGGISHRDATTLSLLQALQGMSEAGTRRTATPIGSIAQTIAPLLMAPIQARQIERQSMLEDILLRTKVMNAQAQMMEAMRGSSQQQANLEQEIVNRVRRGEDPTPLINAYQKLHPAKPEARTTANIVFGELQNKLGRNPTDAELNAALTQRSINVGVAVERAKAQAGTEATVGTLHRLGVNPPSAANPGMSTAPAGEEVIGAPTAPQYGSPELHIQGGKTSAVLKPEKPPKPSPREVEVGEGTQTMAGMRPLVEGALSPSYTGYRGGPIPDSIPGITYKANAYMAGKRASEGGVANFLSQQTYGYPDPQLEDYFSRIGQFSAAAKQTNLAMSSSRGKYIAEELTKHIPDIGLQPWQNRDRIKNFFDPNGFVAQRILPVIPKLLKSGDMTTDDVGAIMKNFELLKRDEAGRRMIYKDDAGRVIGRAINGKLYALPPDAANWGQ